MRAEPSGDVEDDGQQVPIRPHYRPGTCALSPSLHWPLFAFPLIRSNAGGTPLSTSLTHSYRSLPPFVFQPRPYEVRLPVSDKAIGKRIHGEEGLGPEAPHRGNAELRESRVGRFFMPLPGGKSHHYRQVHFLHGIGASSTLRRLPRTYHHRTVIITCITATCRVPFLSMSIVAHALSSHASPLHPMCLSPHLRAHI